MLKKEDCKPGVEVICINTDTMYEDDFKLTLGGIYTIKEMRPYIRVIFFALNYPCISLEEVAPYDCEGCGGKHSYFYPIKNFKLKSTENLLDIFNLKDIDFPLKDEYLPKAPTKVKEDA